jgi:hypothetical protein
VGGGNVRKKRRGWEFIWKYVGKWLKKKGGIKKKIFKGMEESYERERERKNKWYLKMKIKEYE